MFYNLQSDKLLLGVHGLRLDQQTTKDHTGKVPEVKDIVRLSRCREEVEHGFFVDLHCGRDNHGTRGEELWGATFSLEGGGGGGEGREGRRRRRVREKKGGKGERERGEKKAYYSIFKHIKYYIVIL